MGLLHTLRELTAPSLTEVAGPRLRRIEQLIEDGATPDGRCPNGEHNMNGHCVPLAQIKNYAHQMSKMGHKQDTPQSHRQAARHLLWAAKAHREQGHHQDAHELHKAARDHAIMARHFDQFDQSKPCPQGMVRAAHGHCASPNEISTGAHGISKIANFHSNHASMHGGSHNHAQASREHAKASKAHADAAKHLEPLAKTDPHIFKLVDKHRKQSADHAQKAHNHHQLSVRDAVNVPNHFGSEPANGQRAAAVPADDPDFTKPWPKNTSTPPPKAAPNPGQPTPAKKPVKKSPF